MERWLLSVETNCTDPSREKEFNKWYDSIHLPDVLEPEGILSGTRYENLNPGEGHGKYMALYEIETDDIEQTMTAFWGNVNNLYGQGRMTDLLEPVSIATFQQIKTVVKGSD